MSINYTDKEGILYPNIKANDNFKPITSLGIYGRKALKYLQEEYPHRVLEMKMNGELMEVIHKVDDEANDLMITLQNQMLESDPLKNPQDVLKSARHRNSIKMSAEEIVLADIVFKKR
ncbi:MAG: TnpV protein [Clostridiales bacterium]|nr:TnpV protein [Clostridiales bacterium]